MVRGETAITRAAFDEHLARFERWSPLHRCNLRHTARSPT
jgi:hypothetical protein